MKTVFVSVICDLYKDKDFSKLSMTDTWSQSWLNIQFRLNNLKKLIDSGITLILFAEVGIIPTDWQIPNSVTVLPFTLADISTYNKILQSNPELPPSINTPKDRLEYFALMNSKLEFLTLSKTHDPSYEIYCWIDCGIFKFINDVDLCYSRLHNLSQLELNAAFLSPIGNLPPFTHDNIIIDMIWWRFLGSIFFVKSDKLDEFKLWCDHILQQTLDFGKITWEVNIWAVVESMKSDFFETYPADHDDTIFLIERNTDAT